MEGLAFCGMKELSLTLSLPQKKFSSSETMEKEAFCSGMN